MSDDSNRLLRAIAASTVVSGAVQAAFPVFILRVVGAEPNPSTNHCFRIIGAFMVLFGGMLGEAIDNGAARRTLLIWCAAQKAIASAAVVLGVSRGIFGPRGLLVAGFDAASLFVLMRELQASAESGDDSA